MHGGVVGEGHGAPAGNKNGLKTGEFEAIWLDQLDEPEKTLVNAVETEKLGQINEQIRLTSIRIRRMMERIARLKASATTANNGLSMVEQTDATGGQNPGVTSKYAGILGQIQHIEDALTRVQGEMRKLLDSKHRMEMDGSSMNGDDEDFDGSLFAGGADEDDEEGSAGD